MNIAYELETQRVLHNESRWSDILLYIDEIKEDCFQRMDSNTFTLAGNDKELKNRCEIIEKKLEMNIRLGIHAGEFDPQRPISFIIKTFISAIEGIWLTSQVFNDKELVSNQLELVKNQLKTALLVI